MENGVVVPLLDLPALEKIPRATLASKADYLRLLRGYVDGNCVGFRGLFFSDFGSPKDPHFFQGPHYLHFRLKNAIKVRAATIY